MDMQIRNIFPHEPFGGRFRESGALDIDINFGSFRETPFKIRDM